MFCHGEQEKAETRVKYFLLIHLIKMSELKVKVTLEITNATLTR